MIDTTCPNCKAPFARKISLVYEEGFQTSVTHVKEKSTTQTILKTAVKTDGVHTETRQSILSSKLSPPVLTKPILSSSTENTAAVLSIAAFVLVTFLGFKISSSIIGFLLFTFFGTAFLIFWIRLEIIKPPNETEKKAYEEQLAHNKEISDAWEKSYICMACGNQFEPK